MRIASSPLTGFGGPQFFECMGRSPFALLYDFPSKTTNLCASPSGGKFDMLSNAVPGLAFSDPDPGVGRDIYASVLMPYRSVNSAPGALFSDIFDSKRESGSVSVLFLPVTLWEMGIVKRDIERILEQHEVRVTSSVRDSLGMRSNVSSQREIFAGSEETLLLTEMLESMNASALGNGLAYKVYLAASDEEAAGYLRTRIMVLDEKRIRSPLCLLEPELGKMFQIPLGQDNVRAYLNAHGRSNVMHPVSTVMHSSTGGIRVGTFMKQSLYDTGMPVSIENSTMNLGFMITGLPGSGKTREAMAILDSALGAKIPPMVVVISPTGEWDGFARSHGMYLLRMFEDNVPINFFRCPRGVKREKFYESLAMMLASASDAGPYRNPMEKCMLNAFRSEYSKSSEPGPQDLYGAVAESVVRFHAKRTNTGVKYTKHGENIMSALENLRGLLARREYSTRLGVVFEELLGKGIVFNMSSASTKMRPYIYALVLNQLYSIADTFDTFGDNELRLVICIEEAHNIFGEEDSAAVEDIKQRIQDFRKRGVSLVLLTHNAVDIDPGVRRLCQLKLYMKQSPEIAPAAAKELVFSHADRDSVEAKMKHLNSRIGALNHIVKNGDEKEAQDTIFIRTADYSDPIPSLSRADPLPDYMRNASITPDAVIVSKLFFAARPEEGKARRRTSMRALVLYMGSTIAEHDITAIVDKEPVCQELICGRRYTIEIVDGKGRKLHELDVDSAPEITIAVG